MTIVRIHKLYLLTYYRQRDIPFTHCVTWLYWSRGCYIYIGVVAGRGKCRCSKKPETLQTPPTTCHYLLLHTPHTQVYINISTQRTIEVHIMSRYPRYHTCPLIPVDMPSATALLLCGTLFLPLVKIVNLYSLKRRLKVPSHSPAHVAGSTVWSRMARLFP